MQRASWLRSPWSHGAVIDRALRALDRARGLLIRGAVARPAGRWLAGRDARIGVLSLVQVCVAFVLVRRFPGPVYALTPILLGIPHVANDVRHLLLRRALPRGFRTACVLGCGFLLALRAAEAGPWTTPSAPSLELACGAAWIVAGLLFGAASRTARAPAGGRSFGAAARVALGLAVLGGTAALALAHPVQARGVLAFGHNLVGFVIWVAVFRRCRWTALPTVAVVLAGAAFLLFGTTADRLQPLDDPFGQALWDDALAAAPGASALRAAGIGWSFAFLQAAHYGVWLVWIPQDHARGEAPPTFRMSARALVRDFGGAALVLGAAAMFVLAALAAVDLQRTRAQYLSLATFHVYLELAFLAFFLTRGGFHGRARSARARHLCTHEVRHEQGDARRERRGPEELPAPRPRPRQRLPGEEQAGGLRLHPPERATLRSPWSRRTRCSLWRPSR